MVKQRVAYWYKYLKHPKTMAAIFHKHSETLSPVLEELVIACKARVRLTAPRVLNASNESANHFCYCSLIMCF